VWDFGEALQCWSQYFELNLLIYFIALHSCVGPPTMDRKLSSLPLFIYLYQSISANGNWEVIDVQCRDKDFGFGKLVSKMPLCISDVHPGIGRSSDIYIFFKIRISIKWYCFEAWDFSLFRSHFPSIYIGSEINLQTCLFWKHQMRHIHQPVLRLLELQKRFLFPLTLN
jgi:hypothetical protein